MQLAENEVIFMLVSLIFIIAASTWQMFNNYLLDKYRIHFPEFKEIKSYLQTNEQENTMYQNLCNVAKADQTGKFITIQAYC